MIALLSLALVFGGLWLIAMGRETLRMRHSGAWTAMAAAQAQTGQAYACVVGGVLALLVAVVLLV